MDCVGCEGGNDMRLTDADALINDIDNELFSTESRKCFEKRQVRKQPTIEAEPVRHGKWKINREFGDYECSECGVGDVTIPLFKSHGMKYCPNCGAKMDLEVQE